LPLPWVFGSRMGTSYHVRPAVVNAEAVHSRAIAL